MRRARARTIRTPSAPSPPTAAHRQTLAPNHHGRPYRQYGTVPPIARIRADAAQRAHQTAQHGIRNDLAETVVILCDWIDLQLPWTALGQHLEARRVRRRNRWQRAAQTFGPSIEWATLYRRTLLDHWNATKITVPGMEAAEVWVIPPAGDGPLRVEVQDCPHCRLRGVSRGCAKCRWHGTILVPTPLEKP